MALFREYDLRGIVGDELTEDIADQVGRAYATMARERGVSRISLGRDGRLSSPALQAALLRGLLAGGLDVVDLGLCTSPLVYFSLFHLPVQGGIMITGSHNAAEYNGFKICLGKDAIHGEEIQRLRRVMEEGRFVSGCGTLSSHAIIPDYLQHLKRDFADVRADHLHVVIDCGNGAASLVAKQALEQMGCRVTGLYNELDGRFPNHHPDPTVVENLQDLIAAVKEQKAHVGIGYDGDADRIGAVDEQGQILWGDRLMVVYARDILARRPGTTFISEVKASQCLYDDIAAKGGRPIMWKTGHSLMKAKLKEESAVLAGEMSGHMFFADRYFGFDDAVYASCRLVEILAKTKQSVSSLVADLPQTTVTPEIRVDCPDSVKFQLVDQVRAQLSGYLESNRPLGASTLRLRELVTIDGVRAIFDDGWGLIRASNTQPALVLRFEAPSQARLDVIRAAVETELAQARRALAL
ncbi:phosphomannomutase/phosphoglucomutase [Nitrospirales bacterium NOB]|nr:MAG: bifunctional Phosphoglucomutase/Phosphomannomutase [Nitrospira sp. OLB3]MBV6470216.1 Phosphomannomutase/phosphoglucomutase [Nitrospirota bacterium]MCE7964248.1 phosphomannomutase/phosphoglucomutase [Nitrospira sp. NTP2]MCK6492675.1 phosphomannomutase/phosphoglucomutase [Nitrospira sp.]MDL1889483.1 phosphomannomutase/phosphoglucomutase [Nitrospirales bacterium NOB]MEB2337254.1 phosphomannomutase/phosphoglucomutase [Nitrospirales bacterium]